MSENPTQKRQQVRRISHRKFCQVVAMLKQEEASLGEQFRARSLKVSTLSDRFGLCRETMLDALEEAGIDYDPAPEKPSDLAAEVFALKARVASLETTVGLMQSMVLDQSSRREVATDLADGQASLPGLGSAAA